VRLFFAGFFLLAPLIAQPALQYIPVDSRLYADIDLLKTTGLIRSLPSTSRPWTRAEFSRLFAEAESLASQTRLNPAQRWALKRLHRELGGRKPVLSFELDPGSVDADLYSRAQLTEKRQQLGLGFRFYNQPADRFFFYEQIEPTVFNPAEGRIRDSSGWHNPGARPVSWRDRVLWQMEQAYFGFQLPWVRLEFGRDEQVWGPGINSSVMLSDDAPALDQVQLVLDGPRVKFISFSALLSRWEGRHRFVSAQRLELKAGSRLVLGGAMFNVYTWESAWDFSGMLNPLLPLYFSVANSGHGDNLLIGGDAVLYLPRSRVYAQLLIDNFEFNNRKDAPNCVGLQTGFYWTPNLPFDLQAEYVLLTAFTYYHRLRDIMFENYSVPLGHELGPDADRLWAKLRFLPLSSGNLALWTDYTRRGYYNRGDYARLAYDLEDTIFLRHYYQFPARGFDYQTGALLEEVEKTFRIGPELELTLHPDLVIAGRVCLSVCRNQHGAIGVNRTGAEFLFKVEYRY
jgi:hypothetical protein